MPSNRRVIASYPKGHRVHSSGAGRESSKFLILAPRGHIQGDKPCVTRSPAKYYFDDLTEFDWRPGAGKRKVHKFTWVIVAINVLFLIWVVFGVQSVANSTCTAGMTQPNCDAAKAISSAIGGLVATLMWCAVDVALGSIWLATQRREAGGL